MGNAHYGLLAYHYLGLFSRDGNTGSQVFVFDCVERKSFWTSTDNVCVKRDFNRIESPDLDRNELEKRLGQFESNAISALREIGAGRATTFQETDLSETQEIPA